MVTPSGTTDLGFTTNTSFTVNALVDENTSFIVKASYQYFKANQSDGITAKASTNSTTQPSTGGNKSPLTIEFNHSCVTVDTYNALGPNIQDKVRVLLNGKNITNDSKTIINATCYDSAGEKIGCNTMVNGNKYSVDINISYGNYGGKKTIMIKDQC